MFVVKECYNGAEGPVDDSHLSRGASRMLMRHQCKPRVLLQKSLKNDATLKQRHWKARHGGA